MWFKSIDFVCQVVPHHAVSILDLRITSAVSTNAPGHRGFDFEDDGMTGKIKAQTCQYSCLINLFVAMQVGAGCDKKDCDVAGNQRAAVRRCPTGHQMFSTVIPIHFCSQAMERDSECREEADSKAAGDEDSLLWTSECREGMWWPS